MMKSASKHFSSTDISSLESSPVNALNQLDIPAPDTRPRRRSAQVLNQQMPVLNHSKEYDFS